MKQIKSNFYGQGTESINTVNSSEFSVSSRPLGKIPASLLYDSIFLLESDFDFMDCFPYILSLLSPFFPPEGDFWLKTFYFPQRHFCLIIPDLF